MGFVDRGGGRESKGASLRKSKKNPGAAAARAKTEAKASHPSTKVYAVAPPFSSDDVMDCGVAILSRKFDADRDRLLDRARTDAKCIAIMTWCGEVERQEALSQYCSENPGRAFCAIGVHPDNVDRTNKKAHQGWVETTESIACDSSCIAILTGLDLTRELATHFSQELLMLELFKCAARLKLPVVAHLHNDAQTIERFIDWYNSNLSEVSASTVLFHNAAQLVVCFPAFGDFLEVTTTAVAIISSGGLFDDRLGDFKTALLRIPKERFVVGSNSPWDTPQNIDDEYVRGLPNEPANYSYVVRALAESMSIDAGQLSDLVRTTIANTLFKVVEHHDVESAAPRDSDSSSEDSDDGDANEVVTVQQDAAEELLIPVAANGTSFYSCVKCRSHSFSETALVTHRSDARKVTFKPSKLRSANDGCASTLFLLVRRGSVAGGVGVIVADDVVTCAGCGGKMGSVADDAPCPCGAVMDGTTARIIASRVELIRSDVDDANLLALAQQEREKQENASSSESDESDPAKRKDKKLNVKANNRSNMSHYRNKNWAPGLLSATEGLRTQANSSVETSKVASKRKKGRRGPVSDDDE
ncbi:DNase, putative [Bodo saltans]|uniref:DNase, putative n=1 Tax=Bodo saltans TaxID=75058 RepID=A0A0S4JQM7_BODSA|nr:DNase, putative [Bodo saltans]|eukprot:CUG92521.1 DNase, putative [Bodo saltans]